MTLSIVALVGHVVQQRPHQRLKGCIDMADLKGLSRANKMCIFFEADTEAQPMINALRVGLK